MTTVIQLLSNPHTPNLPAWKVDSFFFSVGQAVREAILSSLLRGRKKGRIQPQTKKQKLLTIDCWQSYHDSCWLLTFISEVLTVGSLPRQKFTNQIQPPFSAEVEKRLHAHSFSQPMASSKDSCEGLDNVGFPWLHERLEPEKNEHPPPN